MKKLLTAMFVALLMVGCGGPEMSKPEDYLEILESAVDFDDLQKRGERGGKLIYLPNTQSPFTGWAVSFRGTPRVTTELMHYEDGKLNGLYVRWHSFSNGIKEKEGRYVENEKDGLWSEWYKGGRKREEEHWKVGTRHGAYRWWHDNTQLGEVSHYEDGKEVSREGWTKDGISRGFGAEGD